MPAIRTTPRQFAEMLASRETQNLEFKDGTGFKLDDLAEYAVAFFNAQQGPSWLALGVSDGSSRESREVVGTTVFPDLLTTTRRVRDKTGVIIVLEELEHADGRVLIAHCPESTGSRLAKINGRYRIRRGDSLADMTEQEIADRLAPAGGHDYSSNLTTATFEDLDASLVNGFVKECAKESDSRIRNPERYLEDIGLLVEGQATIAALVLFGTTDILRRLLPSSKICYIYCADKSNQSKATDRHDYKGGMWGYVETLWKLIDNRNSDQFYQHLFTKHPIRTFDKASVREAIINAIIHRDYTFYGATYVKQYEYSLEVVSPGSFPHGVGVENLIGASQPRNILLAEAFQRSGQAEHSGFGVAMMFQNAMEQCKPLPDFSRSNDAQVCVELDGELVHTDLAEHIRHTPSMAEYHLTVAEYQVLCSIALQESVEDELKDIRKQLRNDGIIKSRGTGKATVYSLAIDTYSAPELFNGEKETVLEMLGEIAASGQNGISFAKLNEAMAGKSEQQVRRVANAMKRDGLLRIKGKGRNSRWVATDKGQATLEASDLT